MLDRRFFMPSRLIGSDLILRSPPNWTVICFFGGLGLLHLAFALPSFMSGRWEGYLSLLLGMGFVTVATGCWLAGHEMLFLQSERQVRLRTGFRGLCYERSIPFEHVFGVRVTLADPHVPAETKVELLCVGEEIECPPTPVPRQQALCLALMMGVRLIKVSDEHSGQSPQHRINRP